MEEIKAWRSSDGTVFEYKEECDAHEAAGTARRLAAEFTQTKGYAKGQATRAENLITEFVDWWWSESPDKKSAPPQVVDPDGQGE